MKLEFLEDISAGGKYKNVVSNQLIRLYDFDLKEAERFQLTIQEMIDNEAKIDLTSLDFIQSINCSLTLKLADEDLGVEKRDDNHFECVLTIESYKKMILLIQPFVDKELNAYQWLYDGMNEIDFLFSPGGTW